MYLEKKERFYFLLLLLIKILLCIVFSSDYQDKIFFPFVNFFVENGRNPWDHFLTTNPEVAFPYQPLMLYILSPFTWIISYFGLEQNFVKPLLFKAPLIFADCLIYFSLRKICRKDYKKILLYYFCSPIVIYASFVHSQLDIIPTAFLTL